MDAWETLIDNSSLITGDAWEHLNAQEGEGPGGSLVLMDGLELEIDTMEFVLELETVEFEVEIETNEFEVELETTEFEVEID